MGKDPAFLFYSSDFLSGISDLTMEERGQYITLLCLQHQKGHLTTKAIKLATADATADVMAKFLQDSSSLWYNERLDIEIQKRKEHTEKQRQRALDGWKTRKDQSTSQATADATALPLEDVNKNINFFEKEDKEHSSICLYILQKFNFSEIKNSDKLSNISEFVKRLKFDNKFDWFAEQAKSYWTYKQASGDKTQSLETFIEGGWDRENWTEKLKQQQNGQTSNDTKRAGRHAMAAELRGMLNNHPK